MLLALTLALLLLQPAEAQQAASGAATADSLPSEIPLFPLPEVVLFPGVTRPLLIFEPRYREMVADALKGNRVIGMVMLQPGYEKDYEGRPPIRDIGCAGTIAEYQQLPDGRYVILLRGLTTFRVLSEDQRKPYRLAKVQALPELLQNEDLGPLSTARERLAKLLVAVLPLDAEPPDPGLDDAEFVNLTAQNLRMPEADRQALLERNRVLARARARSAAGRALSQRSKVKGQRSKVTAKIRGLGTRPRYQAQGTGANVRGTIRARSYRVRGQNR